MYVLILSFFSFSLLALTLNPRSAPYVYNDAAEFKAIMATLAPYGEYSQKTEAPDSSPTPPAPRELSKGERAVEEAKARNRAILAQRNNETNDKKEEDGPDKWRAETKKVQEGWKKEVRDQLKEWQLEQKIFEGKVKIYKANTFELPVKIEKIIEKKVVVSALPDIHIVNAAFNVPIRDQNNRPTCSAFAGVRAMEILLSQNNQEQDLSEQYLYWASKPRCQQGPCSEKGSWVTPGYRYSREFKTIDIPLETDCVYKAESIPSNETQVPLVTSCQQGSAKVLSFEEVRTLADVIEKIKQDMPVIIAAKLSENFYRNQGLVTLEESKKISGGKMNSHSLGHALLAVGVMELPEKLKAQEGAYCLVVANSWGKGWGAGGYACLTQNWLEKFRQPSAFVAVTKISVK